MCGSCVNALDLMVSGDGNHGKLELQIVGGGHGASGKKHEHSRENHENYEHKGKDYQEVPDYGSVNPAYVLEGPFMGLRYSAANNKNYSSMANYSQKEDSSYQNAA